METTYRLRNFRAFQDTGPLQMAPIAVFCGENSSGKSSILKSLLLVKQSAVERRARVIRASSLPPLLFNGELTRLGSWTDVVHGKTRDQTLRFTWTASGRRDEVRLERDPRFRPMRSSRANSNDRIDTELDVEFRSSRGTSEELSTRLSTSQLRHNGTLVSLRAKDDDSPLFVAHTSSLAGILKTSGQFINNATYSELRDLALSVASIDAPAQLGDLAVEWEGPFVTSLRPGALDTWLPFFEQVLSFVQTERANIRGRRPDWFTNFEAAVNELRSSGISTPDHDSPTPNLAALRRLISIMLLEVNSAFDECKASLTTYWKRVRYLGPLRHQPQRFYQFDDTGGIDIGVSGEFTVQVLALEQSHALQASRIAYDKAGALLLEQPARESLLTLTNYWLQMMDLPEVAPSSLRQSLYELQVGELGVALPDVGFGVSQVLPIVVECLRATAGDLIILEQPEIHLHPRVQSALADFFISRARDGVHFVIESHSEYMIKRLCRRIAENTLPWLSSIVNITFVSQDADSVASCERIRLNAYGEIDNWPQGFFDTQEDLYWMQAALRRRGKQAPETVGAPR
jgi:predicted ATPase